MKIIFIFIMLLSLRNIGYADVLPAPMFGDDSPQIFETTDPGEFKVTWSKVEGATLYHLNLINKSDRRFVQSYYTKGTHLFVQNIQYFGKEKPFTHYIVRVIARDSEHIYGKPSEERELKIWKKHALKTSKYSDRIESPQILDLKIKDN